MYLKWGVVLHNMKVLITGASGFIGSSLVGKLTQNISNQVIATDVTTKISDIEEAEYVNLNVSDSNDVAVFFKKYNTDVLIHCAGIAHQKIGSIDSEEYQRVNSLATENIAKAAIAANPDVYFIFLSSISVYGEDNIMGEVSEDCKCKPSSDYANSKLDAEKRLVRLYDSGDLKKLDILRLAPVYDSEWSLNLDRRVFAPKKIAYIKFGSGEQEMSAVSRLNLVDFIDSRLKQEEDNSTGEPFCNIFNISDKKSYKFEEMIRVFKQSKHHPDRFVAKVPLGLVWIVTRLMGLILRSKRQWLHSCYDKLAYSIVFDNKRMLDTGFKPKHNLESVFLEKRIKNHHEVNVDNEEK